MKEFSHFFDSMKWIILLVFMILSGVLSAQIPDIEGEANYITSVEYLDESQNLNTSKINIVYFDNYGRNRSVINVWGTPEENDIGVMYEYGKYGRQLKSYLPVPLESSNGNPVGNGAENNIYPAYYGSNYNEPQFFYSEVELEAPPLGRVLKKSAPGEDWSMGSGNEVKYKYEIAPSADAVVNYKATTTLSGDVYGIGLQKIGNYGAGLIHKTTVTDENGSKTEQFVNRKGQTVLIRKYSTTGTGTTLTKHDTYYVYDSYGNLTYMLPPKLSAISSITQTLLDNLGYQYKYDVRNRLVEKKLPGKGWEYIVYDKLDRPVAAKDAVNPWQFVKYDDFNRVVYTGIYNGSESRAALQSALNSETVFNESRTGTAITQDGISLYYTKDAFPASNFSLLTVDYYDSYDNILVTGVTVPSTVVTQTVLTANNNLNGVPVASFVRILGTTDWEKIYTFYDSKLQPVRTHKVNHLGGYTIADSKLDFRGKPELTRTYHKRTASVTEIIYLDNYSFDHQERILAITNQISGGNEERIVENTYDELGMPVSKNVGNRTTLAALQKVDYSYNIRGWMTGINNVQNLVETGFPTDLFAFKINYKDPVSSHFDAAGADVVPMYNGNIAETFWRTASDDVLRGYGYEYDDLNRLKEALYQKPGATVPVPGNYDEKLVYDLNGNITSLQRKSSTNDLSAILTDNLTYTYTSNTNRLLKVTDGTNSATGFDNGTSGTSNDYTYDNNGNMLTDKNKGITAIAYNLLNQPTSVVWSSTKKIDFAYNAAGQKVKKVVTDGSTVVTTDYLDGFQYSNTTLQFFPHAEGYVKATALGESPTAIIYAYNYVYNYTDHLGNIRLSYTKDPQTSKLKILDENHFYPFGLRHNKTSSLAIITPNFVDVIVAPTTNQPFDYRFQSQELQEEHDLNWYAYRYRNYDPAIGRFFNVDPLSESFAYNGVYNFSENRVVDAFELEGLESVVTTEQAEEVGMSLEYFDDKGLLALGGELDETVITFQGPGASNSGAGNHYVPFLSEMKGYIDPFVTNLDWYYDSQSIADNSAALRHDIMNTEATRQMAEGEKFLSSLAPGGGTEEIIQSWDEGNYWYAGALAVMEIPGLKVLKFGKFAKVVGVSEEVLIKGWKVGDPITNLTAKGNVPKWNTVRQRFWKNEALLNGAVYEEFNVLRMKKGLAPQFRNVKTGVMESMELHHTIPQRNGGLFEFIKVTPEQHRLIDPFRR